MYVQFFGLSRFLLDMWSTQKALASFIVKRNVEGMLVAFIDLAMPLGSLPVLPVGRYQGRLRFSR
jgi:hypothetical protein